MASHQLIERWINSVLTFFVVILMFGSPSLPLSDVLYPELPPLTPIEAVLPGALFALVAYGMFTRVFLAFSTGSRKDERRIERKEAQLVQKAVDLIEHVLFGEIGWREHWIRLRLRELEEIENDPELAPLLRWRFRALMGLGVLCVVASLALRFVA